MVHPPFSSAARVCVPWADRAVARRDMGAKLSSIAPDNSRAAHRFLFLTLLSSFDFF